MPKIQDNIDLAWTYDGDYVVGLDGDMEDTSNDALRSFIQEVQSRLRSGIRDWEDFPHIGADVDASRGEPNRRRTANAIRTRMLNALTQDAFMDAEDVEIRFIPVGHQHLMYYVKVRFVPTPENENRNEVNLNILYDTAEDGIEHINQLTG